MNVVAGSPQSALVRNKLGSGENMVPAEDHRGTLRFVINIIIKQDAGHVRTRSYTHAVVHRPGAEAPLRTAGIYDDRILRTSGGWPVAERVYASIG